LKHVLIIAYADFPGTSRLFNQVNVLRRAGHPVTILCCRERGKPRCESAAGLRIIRLPVLKTRKSILGYASKWIRFTAAAFVVTAYLTLRRRFDVVQVFNQPDFLMACGLMPRLRGARLILDYRDPMPETYMSKFGVGPKHPTVVALRWLERICLRSADQILTVSEDYKRRVESKGIGEGKIAVWMNCPDPSIFRFGARTRRAENGFIAVYHGTIARRLGTDCAVRAVALARRTIPGLRLLIVGEGELLGTLQRQIGEEGLQECVEVRRPVRCEDVASFLQTADVGLVPMRSDAYTETVLPTKLLEYAATGVPIIASSTSAVRASFRDNEICFCTPGDPESVAGKLIELWRSPERALLLAQSARARYEGIVNRDSMVRQYLNLIG